MSNEAICSIPIDCTLDDDIKISDNFVIFGNNHIDDYILYVKEKMDITISKDDIKYYQAIEKYTTEKNQSLLSLYLDDHVSESEIEDKISDTIGLFSIFTYMVTIYTEAIPCFQIRYKHTFNGKLDSIIPRGNFNLSEDEFLTIKKLINLDDKKIKRFSRFIYYAVQLDFRLAFTFQFFALESLYTKEDKTEEEMLKLIIDDNNEIDNIDDIITDLYFIKKLYTMGKIDSLTSGSNTNKYIKKFRLKYNQNPVKALMSINKNSILKLI